MSAKVSGKVWELELDPIEKLVLLALSDHADHDGNNVRPGNDLLCAKTGLSQPTVTAKIKILIKAGILVKQTSKTGRGNLREFSVETDHVNRRQYFVEREERKGKAPSTFAKGKPASTFPEKEKAGPTFPVTKVKDDEDGKVKAGSVKVKDGDVKVKDDANTYKEHEPSETKEPAERESPAHQTQQSVDSLSTLLLELHGLSDKAGWQLKDKFQSIGFELAGIGVTPEQFKAFWRFRTKKPGLPYIVGDFVSWRATEVGKSNHSGNGNGYTNGKSETREDRDNRIARQTAAILASCDDGEVQRSREDFIEISNRV